MSTKFTKKSDTEPAPPPLGQVLLNANQWISSGMIHLMHERGHTELGPAHLTFFSHLNCGVTQASDVARRMGISRQAVYKITKELQEMDILSLEADPDDGRQKIISMTERGERVALDSRACLEVIEGRLAEKIGQENFDTLFSVLSSEWGPAFGD